MGIVILSALLRFWNLGSVPPSPDWDEVALGYNAYSIIHTARDEYGKFLPIVFRSFDDYKPGLYVYEVIPSVWLFGLSVFATRLPSAVMGIITAFAVFFLVKELTKNEKLGLLSSLTLALSPWHIQFSHAAFEANSGVAFNILSALFFLKGLKKPSFLFLSIFFITAAVYVYQSERVFAPLFFLSMVLIYWKQLFVLPRKYIISSVLLGLLLVSPLMIYLVTNKASLARAQGVSIFADSTTTLKSNVQRLIVDKGNHDNLGLFFDNRRFVYAKQVFANYISHWDFNWLFITGDIVRHHAPNMGLLYLYELPFLLIGMYMIVFGNFDKKTKAFFISWFFLVPIPASITTGVPHAIRTINFLPLFQIAIAIGIMQSILFLKEKEKNKKVRIVAIGIFFLFALLNISYYLDQYFVQQTYYAAYDWQYGYKDAVASVKTLLPKYKKVIVSNQPFMDQSYMFFLFYLQYPPASYQKEAAQASGGFREAHSFGKFEFRPINWTSEKKSSDILYVGRISDFINVPHILKTINFPDGSPAIILVEG